LGQKLVWALGLLWMVAWEEEAERKFAESRKRGVVAVPLAQASENALTLPPPWHRSPDDSARIDPPDHRLLSG